MEFRSYADVCSYYTTESACYVTIHAHCSIMLHKTINKIYIPLLLKTHFKSPSSVYNFRLPSNVCFGHVMLLKLNVITSESEQRSWKREHRQTACCVCKHEGVYVVGVFVDVLIFVSNVHIHAAILAQRHPLHDFKANYTARSQCCQIGWMISSPKAHKNPLKNRPKL